MDNIDLDKILAQPLNLGRDDGLKDFGMDWSSTLLPDTQNSTSVDRPRLEDDVGLDLDLGDDFDMGNDTSLSVEAGRNAPAPRTAGEDLFSEDNKLLDNDDLGLDFGDGDINMDDDPTIDAPAGGDALEQAMADDDGIFGAGGEDTELPAAAPQQPQENGEERQDSPLSDAPAGILGDPDRTFIDQEPHEEEEEAAARQPQRNKKKKIIQIDTDTVLHNSQIKEQQNDRSKILKPVSFLPKDPLLLTLMNMQKNGDFVSNIMGDGRSRGWAPELRGILSIDVIRKSGETKRKRDSGISDMDVDEPATKSPRLELEDDEELDVVDEGIGMGGDSTLNQTQIELGDDGIAAPFGEEEEEEGMDAGFDGFEDTTAPLVHPADSGPVSEGTKHAVHLLRDRFGASGADGSPSSQKKANVLFQDLFPEEDTSREDATKMFFEVLVLATKDAIKVEQSDKAIGGPLRIRGKRGLWGSWAETGAGGEIETNEEAVEPPATAVA